MGTMSDYRIKRNGRLALTKRAEVKFLWLDSRRFVAKIWKKISLAIYEWIWP